MSAVEMIASLRAEIAAAEANRGAATAPGHADGYAYWTNREIAIATAKIAEIEADPAAWEARCATERDALNAALAGWS